jgi:hypothetical protein
MLLKFPPLEYPITRRFGSVWLTSLAYVLGFLAIIILTIANGQSMLHSVCCRQLIISLTVALVGYDLTTVFQSNFNVTQTFWFDHFISFIAQRPGTLCDTHVFNVGESMVTNSSLFEWKVQAVYQPNAAESGFSYRGDSGPL